MNFSRILILSIFVVIIAILWAGLISTPIDPDWHKGKIVLITGASSGFFNLA